MSAGILDDMWSRPFIEFHTGIPYGKTDFAVTIAQSFLTFFAGSLLVVGSQRIITLPGIRIMRIYERVEFHVAGLRDPVKQVDGIHPILSDIPIAQIQQIDDERTFVTESDVLELLPLI